MQHLTEKVSHIIKVARDIGLHSGAASKLYGVANFLETGMFGRVGRAGLQAIKARQYESGVEVSRPLEEAFQLIHDLLRLQPRRVHLLSPCTAQRVLVAADASYEKDRGRAGFLMIANPGTPEEVRLARVLAIPRELYAAWGVQHTYIAQLELLVLLAVMVEGARYIRDSRGLWYTDNTAALSALVRGTSRSDSLDLMARFVHTACFAMRATPYYEYVESAANWADEISRIGLTGSWAPKRQFSLGVCTFVPQLLKMPPAALATVFAFL
jgi:hypothetical protein